MLEINEIMIVRTISCIRTTIMCSN